MNKGASQSMLTRSFAISVFLLILIGASSNNVRSQPAERGLKVGEVKTLPGHAKRYALIIGVDQYADTQITTLGGASNDAKALANALIQSEEHTSELQSQSNLVCRLLLEKKKKKKKRQQ